MKLKLIILTLLISTFSFAQKKEKIKGNKLVKVQQYSIAPFSTLQLNEKFEVALLKGDTPLIEIETDENLHDVITYAVDQNGVLSLNTTHQITSKKRLNIRITVTEQFNNLILTDKAEVSSLIDLELKKLLITAKENSRVYVTVKTDDFNLTADKNSKIELNLNTNNCVLTLSESSDIKALINANELKADLYQKANAKIEGDIKQLKLRIDNAANFEGEKLTTKTANVIAEGSSDCDLDVKGTLNLELSGSSKVAVYNTPKITLTKFEDTATLYKK